jgi:signal-transduction protein with cAMP-binding, CBS, and nucleotidyltransferase domain
MLVQDLMTTTVVTIPPEASIDDAARQMAGLGVGSLVVVDDDSVVGIVTDRDLVVRGLARGEPPGTSVDRVMSSRLVTLSPLDDVGAAYRTFAAHKVRRLPVVVDGFPVGIIALDDLLLAISRQLSELVHPVRDEMDDPAPGLRPRV